MTTFFVILSSLMLDRLFGEPRYFHPLVGFGSMASIIEKYFNFQKNKISNLKQRFLGLVAMMILIIPVLFLTIILSKLGWFFEVLILTLALGWQSLREHGLAVKNALFKNNIQLARNKVMLMVSRDVQQADEEQICKATIESVLENGGDAIFSTLFWFLIAGAPGVIVYRMVNTLDAMWGYKNTRFKHFGWAAARTDDVMNYIPARLTALSYFLVSRKPAAIHCWRTQANNWKSPNAGPVMASGAGSLGIKLGGSAIYHGIEQKRPILGSGNLAKVEHITEALKLISNSIFLWLIIMFIAFYIHENF